jgi:hypothetical protein
MRFEQEFLPEILEKYPQYTAEQVLKTLRQDILAGIIHLHVPELYDAFETSNIADTFGFEFDRGSLVISTRTAHVVNPRTWGFSFEYTQYFGRLREADIPAWVDFRFGAPSKTVTIYAPEQNVGNHNVGSVTQNFYVGTTPPVARPPSAPEPAQPSPDQVPDEPVEEPGAGALPTTSEKPQTPAQAVAALGAQLLSCCGLADRTEAIAAFKRVFGCSDNTARDVYWASLPKEVKAGGGKRGAEKVARIRLASTVFAAWKPLIRNDTH